MQRTTLALSWVATSMATASSSPERNRVVVTRTKQRDLVSVLPDGSRVYEFHPWEKNVVEQDTYVGVDVPILRYLLRLQDIGEDPADYESIWYYF